MKRLYLLWLLHLPFFLLAQKHDANWVYSSSNPDDSLICTLGFNDSVLTYYLISGPILASSSASYSFNNGTLQCYSDGRKMYTKDSKVIQNGDSLDYVDAWVKPPKGTSIDFYTGVFLPFPNMQDKWAVYLQTIVNHHSIDDQDIGLCYSIVDLEANQWEGKVISKQNLLMDSVYQYTCIQHGNGQDWWIVGHKYNKVDFEIYLLTTEGFQYISRQFFDMPVYDYNYNRSPVISSEMGDWIYLQFAIHAGYLFNFDRCQGVLEFKTEVAVPDSVDLPNPFNYGMAFPISSPSGKLMYSMFRDQVKKDNKMVSRFRLMQANLDSSLPVFQFLTHEEILSYAFGYPELGLDGKIYSHHLDETGKLNFLSIIHRPDDLMDGCGLEVPGKPFPSGFRTSSTPRFPNYRLGPLVGSECDTVTTSVAVPEMGKTYDMTLTPNPSSGPVDVEITLPEYQGHQVGCEVIDGLGRTVSSHTFPHFSYRHSLDASAFAPGLYVVQLIVDGRVVKAEKLVVVGR